MDNPKQKPVGKNDWFAGDGGSSQSRGKSVHTSSEEDSDQVEIDAF
jgi:hypothetical protein